VGSIPVATAEDAMRLAVDRLGPDLDYLPDGETGPRGNWVIPMIEAFRKNPDLRLTREGDWSDYDKLPRFALRPGRRLYGAAIDPGIASAVAGALPAFHAVQAGQPQRTFQVGIPGDVDLAMFTFGPSGPVRHLRPFTEALAVVMHQVYELLGGDVLFQVEIPVEQVALTRAPAAARPALANLLARRLAALAQGAPEGARFGLHLCLGDMNHRPLGQVSDAAPLVALANAATARCSTCTPRWPRPITRRSPTPRSTRRSPASS
jgi:hypothetical protein